MEELSEKIDNQPVYVYTKDELERTIEDCISRTLLPLLAHTNLDTGIQQTCDTSCPNALTLTVKDAAKLLGISEPTARALIYRDDFPAFHVGKRVLISRRGLEDWIESQAASGTERMKVNGKEKGKR